MVKFILAFLVCSSAMLSSSTKKDNKQNTSDSKKYCELNFEEKRSQLECQRIYLEKNISYLQDKINNEEAFGNEPAKLYGFLRELKKVNRKLKRIERINQKSMCRFL